MRKKINICFVHSDPITEKDTEFYMIVPSRAAELLGDTVNIHYIFIGMSNKQRDPNITFIPYNGILSRVPILRLFGLTLFVSLVTKKYKIDTFINVWNHYSIFPIFLGAKLLRAKIIARVSGVPITAEHAENFCRKMRKRFGLLVEWLSLTMADKILFLSNSLISIYRNRGVNVSSSYVISQACNTDQFQYAPKTENSKEAKKIVYVGRIAPKKGICDALNSIAELAMNFDPEIRFLVAGFGAYKKELQLQINALGIDNNVEFLGFIKQTDLPRLYASCDILVLPSLSEGLPNVIMEAMACGLPVVATAVGGIPELLGVNRGFLVPPNNSELLAEKIKQVLRDENLRVNTIKCAREYIEREHSYSTVRHKYINMFDEIFEKGQL